MTCFLVGVSVPIKKKSNSLQDKQLRRQAKKLSKESGICYMAALDSIAKNDGHSNWVAHIKSVAIEKEPDLGFKKSKWRIPYAVDYHDVRRGTVLGQRPNAKMSVKRHSKIGEILGELLFETEYHKRARKLVQDIRITLDCWLGYEYEEMGNAEFNQIYYGSRQQSGQPIPSQKRLAQLKRMLRTAKSILSTGYPECNPLAKLFERFDLAIKTLDKWPATAKPPSFDKGRLAPGAFVRVKSNRRIAMVFYKDRKVVEAYSDAGSFTAGRHEVAVLKKQPAVAGFMPMRLALPYGKWTQANGTEVLFNRDYSPIWIRTPSGKVSGVQPGLYFDHVESDWFYEDRTAPYYDNVETQQLCLSILQEWKVENKKPQVMKLFPAALAAGDTSLLSPKGES